MTEGTLAYREYGAEAALIQRGIEYQNVMRELGLGNVADIRDAYRAQRVSLGANYNKLALAFAGEALEKRTDKVLAIIPWLLVTIACYLAYSHGSYFYIAVAVAILVASVIAKQRKGRGEAIAGLLSMAAIGIGFAGNWSWALTMGMVVASAFISAIRVGMHSEFITERALESDIVFAFLYVNHCINIRDNETGSIFWYRD